MRRVGDGGGGGGGGRGCVARTCAAGDSDDVRRVLAVVVFAIFCNYFFPFLYFLFLHFCFCLK